MKNYIGIVRDHSMSMSGLANEAASDYNATIKSIKDNANKFNQDTIVSVVECGSRGVGVVRDVINSSINSLREMTHYHTPGGSTPLWDSIGDLIGLLEAAPDAIHKDVSFLVTIITDGEENSSRVWSARSLADKIQKLHASDRWSFTFRVPRGAARNIIRPLNIPAGNVLEWDQTEKGFMAATHSNERGVETFYKSRSLGATRVDTFYADLSNVAPTKVKRTLTDISGDVTIFQVPPKDDKIEIRTFLEKKARRKYVTGSGFYQLTKTEEVQDYKKIAVRERDTGKVYAGDNARDLLGLPETGLIKLAPGNWSKYDVFVQSTSVNRKLPQMTKVLYWSKVV